MSIYDSGPETTTLPYETPYFPKLIAVKLAQSARKVVSNANVVVIQRKILQSNIYREEGWRKKETKEEGMRHKSWSRRIWCKSAVLMLLPSTRAVDRCMTRIRHRSAYLTQRLQCCSNTYYRCWQLLQLV